MSKKLKATIESTTEILTNKLATVIWRFAIIALAWFAVTTWNTEVGLRQKQGLKIEKHSEKIHMLEHCMLDQFAKKTDLETLKENTVSKTEFLSLKTNINNIQSMLNTELPKIQNYMGQFTEYLRTH